MRARYASLAFLIVLFLACQPVPAEAQVYFTQIAGARTGAMLIKVDRAVGWPLSTTLHTQASYAGFVVQDAHTSHVVEFFMYGRAVNFGDAPQLFPVIYTSKLQPGTYRLLLVTDGATEISLQTRGWSADLRPRHAAVAQAVMAGASLAPALPLAHASLPLFLSAHQVVAVIGAEEAIDSQAAIVEVCLVHDLECSHHTVNPLLSAGCVNCTTGDEAQLVYFTGNHGGHYDATMTGAATGIQKLGGLLAVTVSSRPRR